MLSSQVSDLIRAIRQSRGFTLQKVANRLGIARQNVYAYESGQRNFTLETLEKIAWALEVDVHTLIPGNCDTGQGIDWKSRALVAEAKLMRIEIALKEEPQ